MNDQQKIAAFDWLASIKPCSFSIGLNDHATGYQTAESWIESFPDQFEEDDPEDVAQMKATDTIWSLQVYPRNPIGFYVYHAATLERAIALAMGCENLASELRT